MKNQIIKGFLFAATVLTFSCNKKLDTVPTGSIDASSALKTNDDVQVALVGSYKDFGSADFFGGRIFMEKDLLADPGYIDWTGTYQDLTQIHNKQIPVDNYFVTADWLAGYKAINDVNNVLGALNVVSASAKNRVEGEAKFIRGASYFELVKSFSKDWNNGNPNSNPGIPLVLKPTLAITDSSFVKRNTVAEVYQQVISDLKDASDKLPESNGFYATKAAAFAMLARVYLQQSDFAASRDAANEAITLYQGALENSFSNVFGAPNSSEDIFAIQVTTSSGTQGFNEFYSSAQRGDVQITNDFMSIFESSDKRANLFYVNNNSRYSTKFDELYGNVHIVRLAEMYLIRAETNFRLGTSVGATPVDDINKIRARAGLTGYTAADLTIDKILKERLLELAFEGSWLDDLKRTKGTIFSSSIAWNSPKLVFPIPKREIVVNSNLTQNEGY